MAYLPPPVQTGDFYLRAILAELIEIQGRLARIDERLALAPEASPAVLPPAALVELREPVVLAEPARPPAVKSKRKAK